jgi:amidase
MFKGRESELSPILREFLEWSSVQPVHTGPSLLDAWIQRDTLRAQFFAQMQKYPILLCPAAAIPAFQHGERSWQIEGKTVHYLDAWSYAEFFNLLGNPAAVIPCLLEQISKASISVFGLFHPRCYLSNLIRTI